MASSTTLRAEILNMLDYNARGRFFSMGAAENNRKHDDLSEWDPWV